MFCGNGKYFQQKTNFLQCLEKKKPHKKPPNNNTKKFQEQRCNKENLTNDQGVNKISQCSWYLVENKTEDISKLFFS